MNAIGSIVLCGGRSLRMGRDKASLPFGPETMLARVVRLVGQASSPIVVVAAPGQELPSLTGHVTIVRDRLEGCGPLHSLEVGLDSFPQTTTFVYATATDTPFLATRWIKTLAGLIGPHDLALLMVDGRPQPLASLYRREAALAAARALQGRGISSLRAVRHEVRTLDVGVDALREVDPDLLTLRNLNTLDEYQRALDLFKNYRFID